MDSWDEKTPDLSKDDELARRITSMALFFTNATDSVSDDDIIRRFYPHLAESSFDRMFRRDRDKLAMCGLVIRRYEEKDGSRTWRVDRDLSFADTRGISPEDAATIAVACRPLLSDPSFAYRDELRIALAKIDRTFSGPPLTPVHQTSSPTNRRAADLTGAFARHQEVDATYRDAQGATSERHLRIYGFFGLMGRVYVVAARRGDDGCYPTSSIRDYRIDRFTAVEVASDRTYQVPEDFFVDDYVFLPFQIGPTTCTATFEVPLEAERDVRRVAGGRGTWGRGGTGSTWSVEVSDVDLAASWAIASAITPVSPDALVASWVSCLEGVLSHES